MSNKRIGIVGWAVGSNSFGVTTPYLEFFSQYGHVDILTPQKGIVGNLDLLVMPGGADLSSIEYGETPSFSNGNPDLYKEYFYKQNLSQYIENNTPIFGICLGMQMLGVHFGCKLTQNLLYHSNNSNPRGELVHTLDEVVRYDEDTNKWIIKKEHKKEKQIKVNSLHHQGIELSNFNRNELKPLYTASNYPSELVEVFKHKELPIVGVQYHPEEIYDVISHLLITKLLKLDE